MVHVDVGWYDVGEMAQIDACVSGQCQELGRRCSGAWFNQNRSVIDQQVGYLAEGEAYILRAVEQVSAVS
jgi:hypothetical protein